MSQYSSLFKVRGNLGGANWYKKDGKIRVREITGVDAERFKSDDAFKKTRLHNQEWGAALKLAHEWRRSMPAIAKLFADRSFSARAGGALFRMLQAGPGNWGERNIEVVSNRQHLRSLELNQADSFRSRCGATFSLTPNGARNEVTLTMPVFDPGLYLTIPASARFFRITLGAYALSDMNWNNATGLYELVNPALSPLVDLQVSAALPVDTMLGAPVSLTAILPGAPAVPATAGLIAMVGIEFLNQINGNYYRLESGNCMVIADIF